MGTLATSFQELPGLERGGKVHGDRARAEAAVTRTCAVDHHYWPLSPAGVTLCT